MSELSLWVVAKGRERLPGAQLLQAVLLWAVERAAGLDHRWALAEQVW